MLLQFSNIGQKINKRKFSFVQCIVPSIASLPGGRACTFNFFFGKDRAAQPLAELRAQVSKLGGWSRSSVFGRAATLNFFLGKDRAARQPGELRVRSQSCEIGRAPPMKAAQQHLIFFWANIELRGSRESCAADPPSCEVGSAAPTEAAQHHLIFFGQRSSCEAAGRAARPILVAARSGAQLPRWPCNFVFTQ